MGYLTTITIHNDGLSNKLKKENEFIRRISEPNITNGSRSFYYKGLRVKVQKSRHMNESALYIHMKNNVSEIGYCLDETERLMEIRPDIFEEILDYIEKEVGQLKEKFRNYREIK